MIKNVGYFFELIDEMLGIIPASEEELIGALDIFVQQLRSNYRLTNIISIHQENINKICNLYISNPQKPWEYNVLSMIRSKPILVN